MLVCCLVRFVALIVPACVLHLPPFPTPRPTLSYPALYLDSYDLARGCSQTERQTWKKRWFVLRPAHLAFYKTSAEYKLLRLLDLTEVHSCTPVVLKKHQNTFGLVSPTRTFYLQADNPNDVREWVSVINDTRVQLISTSTRNSVSSPIPIPTTPKTATPAFYSSGVSSSPSHSPNLHQLTSSESDDASPNPQPGSVPAPPATAVGETSSPSKPVLSGYLMKCGSRRHNWHKRWFILSGEKLIYSRSHMVRARNPS